MRDLKLHRDLANRLGAPALEVTRSGFKTRDGIPSLGDNELETIKLRSKTLEVELLDPGGARDTIKKERTVVGRSRREAPEQAMGMRILPRGGGDDVVVLDKHRDLRLAGSGVSPTVHVHATKLLVDKEASEAVIRRFTCELFLSASERIMLKSPPISQGPMRDARTSCRSARKAILSSSAWGP